MNEYFEQIKQFKGADEVIRLVQKWDAFSNNIKNRALDAPIVLPDVLMYTRPGYGNTRLLHLISEFLDSKGNLMNFYGDVKFFEFKLDYCRPDCEFSEMYRLIDAAESSAGFRNVFKGLVRINIDEWVGHHKEKHFLDFLQFLQINTPDWLIFLTLSDVRENDDTRDLESVVSMYLRIEKITLKMPSDTELCEYCSERFAKYGLVLSEDAKPVLGESISVLRKNKYFYGLHTIKELCDDIVYNLFSTSQADTHIITADMLADFSKDSEYIKRTIAKIKKVVTMGF